MAATLLCRNDEERGRLLDMNRRLRAVVLAVVLLLVIADVAAIPTFGWFWLVPTCAVGLLYTLLAPRLPNFRRPELVLAALWMLAELATAVGLPLAGGPRQYLLVMFVPPVVYGSIIFPPRAVVYCVAATLAIAVGSSLAFLGHAIAVTPPVLAVPVVLIVVLALTCSALGSLDARSRSAAIVDQLTGMFNRMALIPRAAEVAYQAAVTASPVSIVVCDVDNFKAINDELGHSAGDEVLKEVARRLAGCLGPFEPIYRFGGEEFVMMLAGLETPAAADVAERLRQAVSATPIRGAKVTLSAGVAGVPAGQPFDFDEAFARADAALYEAKHAGRNRVSISGAELAAQPPVVLRPPDRRSAAGVRTQPDRRWRRVEPAAPAPSRPWQERLDREHAETGNWLVGDQIERDHMLDLNRLLGQNFRRSAAISFAAIIFSIPWFGWATLIPPLIAGAVYHVIQLRVGRLKRPEFALVSGWLIMQLGIAGGFALSTHSPLFGLPLFLLMVIGSASIFPRRAVVIGVAATAVLLIAAALAIGGHRIVSTPAIVIFPLAVLGAIALTGVTIGRSAIHYRGAAVVDELTGMLNRAALSVRAAELAHQTGITGERVAVILADLDHFKAINDQHGHARGDAVLQEVAYRIRKHLRAFESVYRLGGEEFAVLLAGCTSVNATRVAERIWDAVRADPVDGLPVTMSCGVAATSPGERFDYPAVFARADAALYEAKHSGRDCVRLDLPPARPLAA